MRKRYFCIVVCRIFFTSNASNARQIVPGAGCGGGGGPAGRPSRRNSARAPHRAAAHGRSADHRHPPVQSPPASQRGAHGGQCEPWFLRRLSSVRLSPLSLSVRAAAGRSHINLVQLQPVTSENCRDMGHMMIR